MFFVYSGYASADNYDASYGPTYTLQVFQTEAEVLAAKKEFDEETSNGECSNVLFRVIEGKELQLTPVTQVTKYKLVR